MKREDAIKLFESRGEPYKAELIRTAPEDDTTEKGKISLYRQGEGDTAFIDLCRGPHVPHFSKISPAFKLTHVLRRLLAGAMRRTSNCSASTACPSPRRKSSRRTSTCWRRPRSATIASWAASLTCFHIRKKPSGRFSGTTRDGRCSASSKITFAASSAPTAIRK
ncbi:MAG: hypothetical protein WDN72_05260 [Alphaproteobacteria bacterium]